METLATTLADLLNRFLLFLPRIAAAIVIFIAGLYLANLVTRLMVQALEKRRTRPELVQLISNYLRIALIVLVTMTALQQVEFDLTAFIAGIGIIGFTIGFALQDITQNVVAGLILLVQRPFEIGDLLQIEEYVGYVEAIDIRTTRIGTLDGRDILVPNYLVLSNPVTNYTSDPDVRIALSVSVAFDSDLDFVHATALEALKRVPFVLAQPEPEILFYQFGDSAIELRVYYWVHILRTPELNAVDGGIRAIKRAFDEAGITIPFPIQIELQEKFE